MNSFTIVRKINEYKLYWNDDLDFTIITYQDVLKLKKQTRKKQWRDPCHLIITGVIK